MAFCSVSDLRPQLLRAFVSRFGELDSAALSSKEDIRGQSALASVLYWVNQAVDNHCIVSVKALEFLKEVYEVN